MLFEAICGIHIVHEHAGIDMIQRCMHVYYYTLLFNVTGCVLSV